MRKYLPLIAVIFLFNVLLANAQTTQAPPTAQDAADFINKVSLQFPSSETGDSYFPNTKTGTSTNLNTYWKIELKECKLYFYYWNKYEKELEDDAYDPQYCGNVFLCDVIDLANVSLSNIDNNKLNAYSNNTGAIKQFRLSKLGPYRNKTNDPNYFQQGFNELQNYMETNNYTKAYYTPPYKGGRFDKYTGELIGTADNTNLDVVDFLVFSDSTLQLFKENNYTLRLKKAYDFLIKNCGGGKTQNNLNSKF